MVCCGRVGGPGFVVTVNVIARVVCDGNSRKSDRYPGFVGFQFPVSSFTTPAQPAISPRRASEWPPKVSQPSNRGMPTALVLGGTGFISAHCVQALIGAGYDVSHNAARSIVTALVHAASKNVDYFLAGYHCHQRENTRSSRGHSQQNYCRQEMEVYYMNFAP